MLTDFIAGSTALLGGAANPRPASRSQLDSVRAELSKYERGREVILKHKEEERALRSRQQSELSSATFKGDEKQMMAYSHREALA